jgi:hypothetical protein
METDTVSRRENLRRVLLVLCSVLVALFIFELLAWLEVFDYRGLLGMRAFSAPPDITDRELLHRRPPHSHFAGSFLGGQISVPFQIPPAERQLYVWDVHYDQNGFRNRSDLGRADLVAIGDSFVEAMTVPDDQMMTSLLASMQHQTVVNLGMWGYGPLEELIVLKRYALPLRPHTILWMFSESTDVTDISRYHRAIADGETGSKETAARSSILRRAISGLRAQVRYASRPSGSSRAGLVRTARGGRPVHVYFEYPSLAFSPAELKDLDEVSSVIRTAEELCAAQNIRFVFVFIPSKFRAFRDSCEFPPRSECRNWVLTDLPERLRDAVLRPSEATSQAAVDYLDLTPDMQSAARRGDFPYYLDDGHWSPTGNRIAAEAIGRRLQESPDQ